MSNDNGGKLAYGLSHVANSETSQRWVVGESLDTHGLGRHHLNNRGIPGLGTALA